MILQGTPWPRKDVGLEGGVRSEGMLDRLEIVEGDIATQSSESVRLATY